ncbi:hypothetical protein NU195Hw_g3901t1 [Hortaea werneckii]
MKTVTCLCTTVLGFALFASSAPVDEENANAELAKKTPVLFNSSSIIILPTGFFPTGSGYPYPSSWGFPIGPTVSVGAGSPTVTQPITESPFPESSSFTSVPTTNVTITPSITASPSPSTTAGDNGTAACNSVSDGTLICNGQNQYGFCNGGQVNFENVLPGQACYTDPRGAGRIGQTPRSPLCNGIKDNTLICNGPGQYGICYGGIVSFQDVGEGTECVRQFNGDGVIEAIDFPLSKA